MNLSQIHHKNASFWPQQTVILLFYVEESKCHFKCFLQSIHLFCFQKVWAGSCSGSASSLALPVDVYAFWFSSRERESGFSIIFHLIFCYGLYITCFFHGCILSKIWCDPAYTLQSQYLAKNIISKDFINIQYKIVCFPVLWKNSRYRDGYQLQTKISKWISDMMENIQSDIWYITRQLNIYLAQYSYY